MRAKDPVECKICQLYAVVWMDISDWRGDLYTSSSSSWQALVSLLSVRKAISNLGRIRSGLSESD